MIDQVGTFWIVTKPEPESEVYDICFDCTVKRMIWQVCGGLRWSEIVGIYKDEDEAIEFAEELLRRRDATT